MRKAAAASRYASYDSPSPSPSPRRAAAVAATPAHGSRALVVARSGRGDLRSQAPQPQSSHHGNLGSVLRRLISMDKKPTKNHHVPPAAVAAAAAAKNSGGGGGGKLPGLSRKLLFQKGASEGKKKALTEVKNGGNTRTLAMVLRSERELLTQSKEQEDEIAALHLQLEQKDREVERLKDLCLRQRDEIRALKNAVLFPDSQPDRHLREEISTLTGHIQCLAEELAQVKTEKHTARSCFDDEYCSSPRTPVLNEETAYSLECSIGEAETPNYGSPDEMFVKDLNPCLTPCISKSKFEEYEESISSHRSSSKARPDLTCSSRGRPMSKSSDYHKPISGSTNNKRGGLSAQRPGEDREKALGGPRDGGAEMGSRGYPVHLWDGPEGRAKANKRPMRVES